MQPVYLNLTFAWCLGPSWKEAAVRKPGGDVEPRPPVFRRPTTATPATDAATATPATAAAATTATTATTATPATAATAPAATAPATAATTPATAATAATRAEDGHSQQRQRHHRGLHRVRRPHGTGTGSESFGSIKESAKRLFRTFLRF